MKKRKKPEPKDVLGHLKVHLLQGKTITQNQALKMWRTSRLATYVLRLRKQGMNIITTMRHENGDSFAEYSIPKRTKVNRIAAGTYLRN